MLAIQNKPGKPFSVRDLASGIGPALPPNKENPLLSLFNQIFNSLNGTEIGSSLLGIGSSFLTNALNQQWAQQQQQAAWDREQQFTDQAYQRQLSMIEKYQTPKAMVRMLKEAGLSKGLMYSNGGGTVGTGSVSKGNAAAGAVPMLSNPLSMLGETLQLNKLKAEMDNIKADTQKKEAEAENTKESTENLEIINKNLQDQITTEIQNIQSETDRNKASEELIKSQTVAQNIENEFRDVTFWTEVQGKIQETSNAKKLGEKMAAELKEIFARINNLNVDAELKNAMMQQAFSEMLLANEHILTTNWERQFSKNIAPFEFGTKMQQYKQAIQNTYAMELDNVKKEVQSTKFKGQWEWWEGQILGITQQIVNIGGAIILKKGLYGGATAKTLSSNLNKHMGPITKGKNYQSSVTTSNKPLWLSTKSYGDKAKPKNWWNGTNSNK